MRRNRERNDGHRNDPLEQQSFPDDLLVPPVKGGSRGIAGGMAKPPTPVVSGELVDIFTGGDDLAQDKPPPAEGPRWAHSEDFNGGNQKGIFVIRYKEFDIYAYKMGFVTRWGAGKFFRTVAYSKIKATDEERFSLPPDIQQAILAIRALEFGDFT